MIDEGIIGDQLHSFYFRTRTGDGWGEDAYLDRQPYFRDYPRLLVYETGVHFIDTFRYLGGEIKRVFALLKRLNPVIKGEDSALVLMEFDSGFTGVWDANQYNEPTNPDPRFTFGEFLVEGNNESIRLYQDGVLTLQTLGSREVKVNYRYERRGFCGDCVYFTQKHFLECLLKGLPFETRGYDYLKTLRVQEAVYQSAASNNPVDLKSF
jgi:predicted dehydrogenase